MSLGKSLDICCHQLSTFGGILPQGVFGAFVVRNWNFLWSPKASGLQLTLVTRSRGHLFYGEFISMPVPGPLVSHLSFVTLVRR